MSQPLIINKPAVIKEHSRILHKMAGVIFFIILILTFIIYIIYIQSIIIDLPANIEPEINAALNLSIKNNGLRNIGYQSFWFDRYLHFIYRRLSINTSIMRSSEFINNAFGIFPIYLTVDLTSDLYELTPEEEKDLLNQFRQNKSGKVNFTKIHNLNMRQRILLSKSSGQPEFFNKMYTIQIENFLHNRSASLEKQLTPDVIKPVKPAILGFTGDVVIEDFVKASFEVYGMKYTFKEVNHLLEMPDIMSINLEFPITVRGAPEKKSFTFRSSKEEFKLITDSPIDFLSAANNHAMDFGTISLLDTLTTLNDSKLYFAGIGRNSEEAFKPALINMNNNKLAYYSICEVTWESGGYNVAENFNAGVNKPGIAYYDPVKLSQLFVKMKKEGYLNVIQFHTGLEYSFTPIPSHIEQARKLIDLGADAVICHHPHVINGIEIYKNQLIAYSLGDFLFDIQKENADEGIILYLYVLNNYIVSWSFYPTVSHYGAVTLNSKRIADIGQRFIQLTAQLQ